MWITLALLGVGLLALAAYTARLSLRARRFAHLAGQRAEMLEQVHDAVIVWRLGSGGVVHWNRAAEELYGWARAEALGRPVHDLLKTRFPDGLTAGKLDALLAAEGQWAGELTHVTRGGDLRLVETRMALLGEDHQRLPTVVESNHDVTSQRRAERARQESEARARAIVDTAADAILTIDAGGRVQSFNPEAERVFGYRAEEVVGRNVSMLMPEPYRSEHDGYLARYHRTGERRVIGVGREVSALRKDGSVFPVELAVGEANVGDRVYTGILRDLTLRKAAEAEREQLIECERAARVEADRAARLKDEFLAAVSHELRTPLTAILGWTDLLVEGGLDPGAREQALRVIARNAHVQLQVVNDLLDVSRIVAGKLRLEPRPTLLAEVVENAICTIQPTAETRHIRIEKDLARGEGEAVVQGDPDRLQQVVWNLLANAVKFTPSGGTVHVTMLRVDSAAEIVVRDTGAGIPADFVPHLFQRFRQADASTTRAHGGLGLGLSLVRHIVELHGGTVRAESQGEGLGATFVVRLPLSSLRGAGLAARAPALSRTSLAGVRVLVVDDEPDTRQLVQRILEDRGAEVVAVGCAADALHEVRQRRPDVLVADIGMPGQDGYQLMRALCAVGPSGGTRIPAAALTAFARPEDRARALAAGYQTHLTKPVDAGSLVEVVERLARAV